MNLFTFRALICIDPARVLAVVVCLTTVSGNLACGEDVRPFLKAQCFDCHSGAGAEAGLDLSALSDDLSQIELFAKWERIHDRVAAGEMPPKSATAPSAKERTAFLKSLGGDLTRAHQARKGTVLRRLNRIEYQNTLNDLFDTELDLAAMLPEDGRSHEFDNVGESLGLSMVHLQLYMDAVGKVLDAAIVNTAETPETKLTETGYQGSREAEQFVGKVWKQLDDTAIVRFAGGGYPSGMMRGSNVRERGRYRVRVTGYAHQSASPITFSVGGTSFAPGSSKPIYQFFSVPPNEPTTVEFESIIDRNYMLAIEPYGISDPNRYQRKTIDDYDGPGLAILKVTLEGPLLGEFPSRGHQLVFDGINRREIMPRNPADRKRPYYRPRFEILSDDETADASQSLQRVAEAAFRQPVKAVEVTPYVQLFQQQRTDGATFEEALRTAVTALFCSPRFLYLQENAGKLDDFALASRLSYFLTRTTPDPELLALAKTGKLKDGATLRAQTERLLKDPRSDRLITDLCDSWLDLRELDFTMPDNGLFPEFDEYLRYSMPLETQAFLHELIRANEPVTCLVKSDFAMLNSRLAEHYELPAVVGAELRRVTLPPGSVRGGLLTQASILKVTANGTNSSPVKRGAWVMERILGETPAPPPPGIPGVEPDIRGASTLRGLLDKHRSLDSCNACHRKIDPPGFALESFNPIGGFRDRYRSLGEGERVSTMVLGRQVRYRLGPNVDSSGELPEGRAFAGFVEFRDQLAADPKLLATTFVAKLLTFATGRELGFSDRTEVAKIVDASAAKGYRVRDLLHLVVQSEIFRNK